MTLALSLIFFLSGSSALVFETLWFRQAGLMLGNSVWASSLVMASFMAGLALGNAFAGKADRVARPVLVYAALEGAIGLSGTAAYAASKGAVAQITKALANEWAAHGININAIAPGYMATDNTKALREDPVRSKAILDRIPAGRWGTPQDLAGVAVFLASPASDYVNGHILVVDGGWLAR